MMKHIIGALAIVFFLACCGDRTLSFFTPENPELELLIPQGFPALNDAVSANKPTQFGVALGEQLFKEKMLSTNNTISCASCHKPAHAFADDNKQAIGIEGRVGLRNVPAIQNMAFQQFYNWDGNRLTLESQALVPIITHEEMNSSILEVIGKLKNVPAYRQRFKEAFGDDEITADRIYRSLAQYQYTLISSNSKYDKVKRHEGATFTASEARGYQLFLTQCASCHSTELFTDQSFRNIGFPVNPSSEEAGRARVTGDLKDMYSFRVPSLRNVALTAPYGSFGQFATLKEVLDYLDKGVLDSDNLDPILKDKGNRIALSEEQKEDIIAFLHTLTDAELVKY